MTDNKNISAADAAKTDANSSIYDIDKEWIGKSFGRAASSYEEVAVLQKEVATRLIERLELVQLKPELILDVGSGTGFCSRLLEKRYKKTNIVSLDLSHAMLSHTRKKEGFLKRFNSPHKYICGDAERLPLADDSVDLIVSSLALQWCDLESAFAGFRRVLKPGGLLMFSTMGPDTLKELRRAWAKADGYAHVSAFIDMHDVGDALMRAGFSDPVMDVETITVTYPTVKRLMLDLKAIGSRNALEGRSKGLMGKDRLKKMIEAYEQLRKDGVLPASYEVVYGHAWIPDNINGRGISPSNIDNSFPVPVRRASSKSVRDSNHELKK